MLSEWLEVTSPSEGSGVGRAMCSGSRNLTEGSCAFGLPMGRCQSRKRLIRSRHKYGHMIVTSDGTLDCMR